MSTPILGEIRMFGFSFAPRGWAFCDGQLLPIAQNTALFSLLGTTYGGDGQVTFALPDLSGRMPMHRSSTFIQGQKAGTVNETLTVQQVPSHRHAIKTNAAAGTFAQPGGHVIATGPGKDFSGSADSTKLKADSVATTGGGQSHNNMPPYLAIVFCIALQGIYPSRN